jgi:hypothetical protein
MPTDLSKREAKSTQGSSTQHNGVPHQESSLKQYVLVSPIVLVAY